MKIHVLLSIWLTKSISDTLVWYILLIDMKTIAQCFHTFRCNYLLTIVLSEKLSHEPVCHFKYFPIVLDTKCAVWINRKGICNGHVLVHCWELPIKAQDFYQISYSLLVFIWILTAVSLGVGMVVPGEVWILCWLENVGYFQSEQQDKTLAYWFTLGNKSQLLNTWDSGSYWF